jgi:hypothetical protein
MPVQMLVDSTTKIFPSLIFAVWASTSSSGMCLFFYAINTYVAMKFASLL